MFKLIVTLLTVSQMHIHICWEFGRLQKSLIPFLRIIFSGLHAGIGIGNWLIQHLEEFIDVDVEIVLQKEFQLRASEESSENIIKHLRHLKEVWTKSPEGGRLLQKKER